MNFIYYNIFFFSSLALATNIPMQQYFRKLKLIDLFDRYNVAIKSLVLTQLRYYGRYAGAK